MNRQNIQDSMVDDKPIFLEYVKEKIIDGDIKYKELYI